MAPDGIAIHATRVRFAAMDADPALGGPVELGALRAYLEPPRLDEAAELLAGAPVSVIAYAFTSTGYLDGGDEALLARLAKRTSPTPVVATCSAAVQAIRALGARRIALVHPPWFSSELNAMGAAHFRDHGIEVVFASPADLAGGQLDVQPADVHRWALANVPDDADAVLFGGNGFRVVSVIDRLERDLHRPVLSANQVLLWGALRAAGVTASIAGYGRLLADSPRD
jgi:maleate isomerase